MGFFSLSVRGQALTRMLPRSRRREANTSTYAVDYLTRSVRRASGLVLADHPPRIVACPDTAELLSLGARYTVFESRFVPFYGTRREARLGLIYHAGRQTNLSRQSVAGCDTPGRDCTYRIPRPLPHPWDRRPMAANDHHDGIANS